MKYLILLFLAPLAFGLDFKELDCKTKQELISDAIISVSYGIEINEIIKMSNLKKEHHQAIYEAFEMVTYLKENREHSGLKSLKETCYTIGGK